MTYLNIICNILMVMTIILSVNALLIEWFLDKKTRYKYKISNDYSSVSWLMIFFSFIIVFFMKRFRNYRKDIYFINMVVHLEREKTVLRDYEDIWNNIYLDEYQRCKEYVRYQKLQKIRKKLKK